MKMTKEERELLRQQAIEANERRIILLETFLDGFLLDSEVNKAVSLELGTAIAFIEQDIEKLKKLVVS